MASIKHVISVLAFIALVAMVSASFQQGGHELKAKAAASTTLVAVISPLPDEVSNGTWSRLDGSLSNDTEGLITNYTWDILYKGTHTLRFEKSFPFKFTDLGLYTVTLTVTDDMGNTSVAYAAVYAIIDSDNDSLPDWWEIKYFNDLNQTGSGDFDRDGYTNLEEYAAGQDPTVKDPGKGIQGFLTENWMYFVAVAAVIVVALIIMLPRMKRKRNATVKKKIEAAIEIEKALESEE